MSVRTMFLALSTTALLGCASTPAAGTRTEARSGETEAKMCSCDHKAQEGAQTTEGHAAGCSCPHCGHARSGEAQGTEGEAATCGCAHEHEEQGRAHHEGHQG
ncbi:MAG TPA: hypothetical protein VFZ09_06750 [Archangium sp.]|uniref:hypothetical protein n=1 Tax=Archangium sp. TaxID=1872627 RepID=UPI002E370952|nr:hypothetical protein [Archangium sp.]HEX5745924.1 hypothetical protein [Archangium sp.]